MKSLFASPTPVAAKPPQYEVEDTCFKNLQFLTSSYWFVSRIYSPLLESEVAQLERSISWISINILFFPLLDFIQTLPPKYLYLFKKYRV